MSHCKKLSKPVNLQLTPAAKGSPILSKLTWIDSVVTQLITLHQFEMIQVLQILRQLGIQPGEQLHNLFGANFSGEIWIELSSRSWPPTKVLKKHSTFNAVCVVILREFWVIFCDFYVTVGWFCDFCVIFVWCYVILSDLVCSCVVWICAMVHDFLWFFCDAMWLCVILRDFCVIFAWCCVILSDLVCSCVVWICAMVHDFLWFFCDAMWLCVILCDFCVIFAWCCVILSDLVCSCVVWICAMVHDFLWFFCDAMWLCVILCDFCVIFAWCCVILSDLVCSCVVWICAMVHDFLWFFCDFYVTVGWFCAIVFRFCVIFVWCDLCDCVCLSVILVWSSVIFVWFCMIIVLCDFVSSACSFKSQIAKAAKELLLHFRSSHFPSTQWRCAEISQCLLRTNPSPKILDMFVADSANHPDVWKHLKTSQNNTFKLTHLTQSSVHCLAEQHANPCCWLMTVRATLFCFSTPLSKRFRASSDLGQGYNPHGQSHAAGTKQHFDWKRNICESSFMKRHVAIICQQLMNKFHYTIRLQQPVCKVADFKQT